MRFSGATTDEWVLLELDPHLASGGYGHGGVLVWSPSGELLASGSQSRLPAPVRLTNPVRLLCALSTGWRCPAHTEAVGSGQGRAVGQSSGRRAASVPPSMVMTEPQKKALAGDRR